MFVSELNLHNLDSRFIGVNDAKFNLRIGFATVEWQKVRTV